MSNPITDLGNPSAFDADALINECLDLESEGRPDELRDLLIKGRALCPDFDARLLKTRAAVGQVRGMPEAPNVAPEVLCEVDYLRPFLSPRRRRQISATRVAVAAAAVLTLSFIGVMQRMYPQATSLSPDPAPITGVVEASRADATNSVRSLVSAVDEMRQGVSTRPLAPAGSRHARSRIWPGEESALSMGDTSRYEIGDHGSSPIGGLRLGGLASGSHDFSYALTLSEASLSVDPMARRLGESGGLRQQPRASRLIAIPDPATMLLDFHDGGLVGGLTTPDLKEENPKTPRSGVPNQEPPKK